MKIKEVGEEKGYFTLFLNCIRCQKLYKIQIRQNAKVKFDVNTMICSDLKYPVAPSVELVFIHKVHTKKFSQF